MKIYWSNNSVPELRGLPRKEQDSLLREASERVGSAKGVVAVITFVITSFAIAIYLVCVIPFFVKHELLGEIAVYSLAPVVLQVVTHFNMRACRPVLREIRERDYGENWSSDCSIAHR